jgi:hypothetical protein
MPVPPISLQALLPDGAVCVPPSYRRCELNDSEGHAFGFAKSLPPSMAASHQRQRYRATYWMDWTKPPGGVWMRKLRPLSSAIILDSSTRSRNQL